MRLERFQGRDLRAVSDDARRAMGDDVVIIHTRALRSTGSSRVEVVAALHEDLVRFRDRIRPEPLPLPRPISYQGPPFTLAAIGPAGAGKTTALARALADHRLFGAQRTLILTLCPRRDTRAELQWAIGEHQDLPVLRIDTEDELVHATAEAAHVDAILIDTPVFRPDAPWLPWLTAIHPTEVHLVLPASLRPDIALDLRTQADPAGVTHLLLTHLDEVPDESGVAELAALLDLPARWATDHPEASTPLHPAPHRILGSILGSERPKDPDSAP